MASRQVTRRQAVAGAVEAAANEHAVEVAQRVERRLAELRGSVGAGLDLGRLQEALGELLAADRRALEAADAAHIEELRGDAETRERRDAATARLHEHLSRLRATVAALYGAGADARLFALRGRTGRNPEVLRRQAARVLARLRDVERPLPAPRTEWLKADPSTWAAELAPALAELEAALGAVHADRRRAEATHRAKQEALDRYDRTYTAVTGCLASLYHLADLDTYEERLRPRAARRAAGQAEQVGAGGEARAEAAATAAEGREEAPVVRSEPPAAPAAESLAAEQGKEPTAIATSPPQGTPAAVANGPNRPHASSATPSRRPSLRIVRRATAADAPEWPNRPPATPAGAPVTRKRPRVTLAATLRRPQRPFATSADAARARDGQPSAEADAPGRLDRTPSSPGPTSSTTRRARPLLLPPRPCRSPAATPPTVSASSRPSAACPSPSTAAPPATCPGSTTSWSAPSTSSIWI
jgi:hypothetical protein